MGTLVSILPPNFRAVLFPSELPKVPIPSQATVKMIPDYICDKGVWNELMGSQITGLFFFLNLKSDGALSQEILKHLSNFSTPCLQTMQLGICSLSETEDHCNRNPLGRWNY